MAKNKYTSIELDTSGDVPTIEEFSKTFLTRHADVHNKPSEADKKRQVMENFINPMLGHVRLNELKIDHVDEFVRRMKLAGASPKTINNRLTVLSRMMNFAVTRKKADAVPPIKLLKVTKPDIRFLTAEEVPRLLRAAGEEEDSVWLAMVSIALNTGLRVNELRALKWSDLDLKRQMLRVCRNFYGKQEVTPKSGKFRNVPLNALALHAFQGLPRIGAYVFAEPPEGHPISYWHVNQAMHRMARAAALRDVGWHTLRHTFASHLVMAGVPLKVVQELLGHATIDMTMRYTHLVSETKDKAVDVLVGIYNPSKI